MQASDIKKKHPSWEFPDFETKEFFKKKHSYAVCIFVINEAEKIQNQLQKMKPFARQIDIVIVDGGSTDGSLTTNFIKKMGVRTLLVKRGPGKLSAQMRMAFAYCLASGYQGVVVIDGNNKDDTTAIPSFIRLLDQGFDHIQGSRFIKGGKAINTPIERLIGVRLIHAPLISLAAHRVHTDTTNGFRAYSAKLLEDKQLLVFRDIFRTYELHYYLAIESSRAGTFRLTEIPVTRSYPKDVKTPTKISPIKGNINIIKILTKAVLRKYRPNKKERYTE